MLGLDISDLSIVSLAMFLAASGLFLGGFQQGAFAKNLKLAAMACFVTGFSCLLGLAFLGLADTSIWFCLSVSILSILGWFIWRLELIGTFTAPIVSLALLVDSYFGHLNQVQNQLSVSKSLVLKIHIASALVGQAFAAAACGISLLLLWQERKLKSRDLISVPKSFPAMHTLDKVLRYTLWVGFSFITVGLLTGAVIVRDLDAQNHLALGSKSLWAILVWGWYLAILVLAQILSYRPHKIARMSLIGFLLMALTWFGMAFSWQGIGAP